MKKKTLLTIAIISGVMTLTLVGLGVVFDKEDLEKQHGRTDIYDVSVDGTIAYVFYKEGHPGIYLNNLSEPVVQLEANLEIVDISFSPNGKNLIYSSNDKNKREMLNSQIFMINLDTKAEKELFQEETLITEVKYHPTNSDYIYYLKAGTFQNYSPIASARPHDIDLFSFQISNGETKQYTDLKKYMIHSLQLSKRENAAYVVMDDDAHAETAEDIFVSHQRIFKIVLDEPYGTEVVSPKDSETDIWDFTITPDDDYFIYQAVANTGENGNYQYELFNYNRQSKEVKQLTNLKEHTSHPVISADGQSVYFIVDTQFGKSKPDYELYKMNIDGSSIVEVPLAMN